MLNVLDEFTHESLAIRVARKHKAIAAVGVKTAYIAPAAHGRTATSRASTPACVTSCWTGNFLFAEGGSDHVIVPP